MLDLNDILKPAPTDALHALADNDQPDMARIVTFLTQMQAGIDMLTEILVGQKAELEALKIEVRRIKARTDAPARSSILRV